MAGEEYDKYSSLNNQLLIEYAAKIAIIFGLLLAGIVFFDKTRRIFC